MKRILMLVSVLILVLALCGCTEKKQPVLVTTAPTAGDSVKEGAPSWSDENEIIVDGKVDDPEPSEESVSSGSSEESSSHLLPGEGMG